MKIKVLHITKMKGVSGSENHLLTLLSELDKLSFDVHIGILTAPQHLELLSQYRATLEQVGVTVRFFHIRRHIDVFLLWRLYRYILREGFDVVHTHLIHADLYGTLAAKFAGVRAIISSRHNDDRFRQYRPIIWLNRFLAHWQTKLIVISDWVGQFLRDVEGIPAEKIVRIHYGLHPESILAQADPQYVRQQFHLPENACVIGTIARLSEQKGQRYLLQALPLVIEHYPNVRFLILGDGELRDELTRMVADLGIAENVILAGYRHDALKLLSGFECFVFPSLWEGFGLVLLEAMALKKAVIASRASAIPESVIDEETGILVPPRSAEDLARAMLRLLDNPDIANKLGQAGYARLQEHFAVKKMVGATEAVYAQYIKIEESEKR